MKFCDFRYVIYGPLIDQVKTDMKYNVTSLKNLEIVTNRDRPFHCGGWEDIQHNRGDPWAV